MQERTQRLATRAALAAALVVGSAVAANAARDAIFLSVYGASSLPWMVTLASAATFGGALLGSWIQGRVAPRRFAPAVALFCALGVFATIPGLSWDGRLFGTLFYVLVAAVIGAVMPAMWSVFNERFDPDAGKRAFTRIAYASTLGAVLGGLGAERLAALFGQRAVLAGVGSAFVLAAGLLVAIGRAPTVGVGDDGPADDPAPVDRRFLGAIALLVVSLSLGGELVDFVLKDVASERWSDESLLRFFALFYAGTGLVGFVGQVVLSERVMRWFGPARAAGVLPFGLVAASLVGMATPALVGGIGLKTVSTTFKTVFFRASYELLFVPMPLQQKRFAKVFLDVGMTSLGGVLGGGVLGLLVAFDAPVDTFYAGVAVSALLAGGALAAVQWGYVRSLSTSVVAQAERLSATESLLDLRPEVQPLERPLDTTGHDDEDAIARQFRVLRARDPEAIRDLLAEPLANEVFPLVVDLLAWDDVSDAAKRALATLAPSHTGALADVLLDPDRPFAHRRRVAQVLEHGVPERARDALLAGLRDRRFEVRFHCARALLRLREAHVDIEVPTEAIEEAAMSELQVDEEVWAARRVGDRGPDDALSAGGADVDNLAHVFRLLATIHAMEPIQACYRGLTCGDSAARGTALEYLDNVLPPAIRQALEDRLATSGQEDAA